LKTKRNALSTNIILYMLKLANCGRYCFASKPNASWKPTQLPTHIAWPRKSTTTLLCFPPYVFITT